MYSLYLTIATEICSKLAKPEYYRENFELGMKMLEQIKKSNPREVAIEATRFSSELAAVLNPLSCSVLFAGVMAATPRGDGHPVVLMPGFNTTTDALIPLKEALKYKGYNPHDWGQGKNLGRAKAPLRKVSEVVDTIAQKAGEPVTLIGHSLSGIYAEAIAINEPEDIRQIITLGSPINPQYLIKYPHRSSKIIERLMRENDKNDPQSWGSITDLQKEWRAAQQERKIPVTHIYSDNDPYIGHDSGYVPNPPPGVVNKKIMSSHLGMGLNLFVIAAVLNSLPRKPHAVEIESRNMPVHEDGHECAPLMAAQ